MSRRKEKFLLIKEFFRGKRKYLFTIKIMLLVLLPLLIYYVPQNILHIIYLDNLIEKFQIKEIFANLYLKEILEAFLAFLIINFIFTIIRNVTISAYKKSQGFSSDHRDKVIIFIEKIGLFLSIFFFIIFLVVVLGINIVGFLTSLSVFALAIIVVFRQYIANFFGGLLFIFSDIIKIKDYVKIGTTKGRVTDMTFTYIKLLADDGDYIYIPNTVIIKKEITNYSKTKEKRIRYDFALKQDFYSILPKLEEYLKEELFTEFQDLVKIERFKIRAIETKKDYTDFKLEVIVPRFSFMLESKIKKFVSNKILEYLSSVPKKKTTKKKTTN